MNRRFAFLLIALFTALASVTFFVRLARASSPATNVRVALSAQEGEPPHAPQIITSRRISIPFGIAPTLPLINQGNDVVVSGHGGCPDGEIVTIAISITQFPAGAIALGETTQPCTGFEEPFQLIARRIISPSLTAGPAEACGTATMRLGDGVMEIEEWCRAEPAQLVELAHQLQLPLVARDAVE